MKQGTRQPGLFLGPDHLPVSEALDKKYRADLHGVLAQIPLFKMLGEAELSGIVASSAVEMYNPGEVVCREGAEDHRMLVVLDGFVTMEMTLQNSDAKLEQEHGAGFTVGLLSAIAKRPNTASIVAGTGGCLVAALPAAALGAAQEDPQSSQQHANVHMPPDYGKLHFEPAMQHPPQPPRPPRRARVLHNEDFLSYMLSSFGDPERLARLQMTFQRSGSVNFRLFFATWYTSTQRTRALEALNEKIIMRCAKEVLVTWHQCARRAAIERIDVEIDNLGIVDLSLELSLGSPREASTHALRMQAVLTALRHARAAEREAALRASDQEMAHEEVVLDLRKQLSEMSALLKQTEDKLMRATQEIKSQNDTIGSLCTMYLYKQEELQRLQRMNKKDSESPAEDENGGLPFSHAEVLMSSNSSSSQGHASFSHMVDSNEAKMPPKHHAEVGEHGEEFQVNGDDSEVDKPRSQPVMPHQNWPHPGSFSPGIEKRRSPHHKHRLPDYVHPEKTMEPHAISPFQRPLDPGVLGVKEFFITKLEGVEREHAEIFEGRHASFSPEAHETGASSQVFRCAVHTRRNMPTLMMPAPRRDSCL